MTIFIKQDCPLCDKPAEFGEVDAGNIKYFDCPHCGMFQISKRAEKLLLTELPNRKRSYSLEVNATPADHLFLIRMPSHEFRQQSDDKLQAEYRRKAELHLTCR